MIEFYSVKGDPNVVVMREKGARGPARETRIILSGHPLSVQANYNAFLNEANARISARRRRKKAKRK